MPLDLLLPLVIGGIAGIALMLHLTGHTAHPRFADPAAACAAWRRQFPTQPATRATLLAGGRAALVETAGGSGVVWWLGSDTTARPLAGARLMRRGDRLVIRFPDFTAPRLVLPLDAADAATLAHLPLEAA